MSDLTEIAFKDNILEWNTLKESSKKYADGLKNIRNRMKVLTEENIKFMTAESLDACNVEDGEIALRRTVRKVIDVKRSNLPEILTAFYIEDQKLSPDSAELMVDKIGRFIEKNYSKSTESLSLVKTYKK
jgi:hypothetical protein